MGFPLRSNIFRNGSNEQKYFSTFPVQAVVLFSPKDLDFVEAFRSIFLTLDGLTGNDVVFFAVLDPPQDWLTNAENQRWWQDYRNRLGQTNFSVDDRVLVKEIARLFGVGWGELPQIVISTNLWTGEYIKSATSPIHLQRQLETLTNLVHEWGQPNIGHIAATLSDAFGVEVPYHPPDDELRYRFYRVYGVLEMGGGSRSLDQYQWFLERELHQVEDALGRIRQRENNRQSRINGQDLDEISDNTAIEDIIEDAAGKLVAPSTVAMRISHQFRRGRERELADMLEEESLVMIETALTVGNFLELLENGTLPALVPLRLGTRGRNDARWHPSDIDFTSSAQGAWKAFELEINLSLIQAARASIFIKMPEFFSIYDSGIPSNRSKIATGSYNGRKIYKDINQLNWEAKQTRQHRFLMLSDALSVIQTLSGTQDYEAVISMCLDHRISPNLFHTWQTIQRTRNRGSHIEPLRHQDFETMIENVLSPDTLEPLIRIKKKLSTRH